MTNVHRVMKQCKYHMKEVSGNLPYIYIVIDKSIGCEQSWADERDLSQIV